jgi:WD40 repeat protein
MIYLFFIIFLLISQASSSNILPFGRNKVTYRQFNWQKFETPHFEIYFYPEEEGVARKVAYYAEKAYEKHSSELEIQIPQKVPIFVYKNQPDFQQTNIISGYIGDGVGGFAEALKNRIAIPIVSSQKRLKEVVFHEVTHVFQYEVLYGGAVKQIRLLRSIFVPLWFIEGMAEYQAEDQDPSYTNMLIKDAVISNRLKSLDKLDNFNHFDGREVVLAYKLSQSVLEYISSTYGKEKIGAMLKEYRKPEITLNQCLKHIIGIELNELNEKWQYSLKEKYWNEVKGKNEPKTYANPIYFNTNHLYYNSTPTFSPDGNKLILFSDYLNYTDIFLLDLKTYKRTPLLGVKYEYLDRSGNGLSWSNDGKYIAFSGIRNNKYEIFIYDTSKKKVIRSFNNGFDIITSPAFSPDGKLIAFSGTKDGKSDIYICDIFGNNIIQITNDEYDDNMPNFSPDGNSLVYSSERDGYYQIMIVNINTKEIQQLTFSKNHHINPSFNKEGNCILFSGDIKGKYDIYLLHLLNHKIIQLTDVKIGLFSPKFSSDGKKIVFTSFENGKQEIYISSDDKFNMMMNNPVAVIDIKKEEVEESESISSGFSMKDAEMLVAKPYYFSPSLDLVYFAFGYDSVAGFIGAGYFAGSDLTGDNSFEFIFQYFQGVTHGYQFTYFFLPWRVNFGITFYNWSNILGLYLSQNEIFEYNYQQLGGGIIARLPFDRFYRIDFILSSYKKVEKFEENILEERMANSISISFVREKRVFNIDEPISGSSNNITIQIAEKLFGGTDKFTDILSEHHLYFSFTREDILAMRLFFGISTGENKKIFLLGGSDRVRGYPNNEVYGTNIFFTNIEYRFPLHSEDLNIVLWPFNILLIKKIKSAAFFDFGIAANEYDEVTISKLKTSIGAGIRIHTFLLQSTPLIIRFDVAKRNDSSQPEMYYIAIGHTF